MTLWGGRFQSQSAPDFAQFNDSLPFDYRLVEQDIQGSIAWAKALASANVLTQLESKNLIQALLNIRDEVVAHPSAILSSDAEDIHTWVECELIKRLGNLGKKLHTGRSRNDQVATDLKLWCIDQGKQLQDSIIQLQQALFELAKQHLETVFPGFTHLQQAQPISFSHWCHAYFEMLERDHARLSDALARMDTCPLGSGALAGTGFPIDRQALAYSLNFTRPTANSLDTVSDRDFVFDLLSVASLSMLHLSRMAEDLIIYNSGMCDFISFSDEVTSGSSLMPQKKNPDAMELIRGKTGRVLGALQGFSVTLKALPMAYNKDLQEDKEGLFDTIKTWKDCLNMASLSLSGLQVNQENTLKAAKSGYTNATALADYLVQKGIPFRQAHHIVGQIVLHAIQQQTPLESVSLESMQSYCPDITSDVYFHLSIHAEMQSKQALGGVSQQQLQAGLGRMKSLLSNKTHGHLVRPATLNDLHAIAKLVNHWADAGENLPRTYNEITRSIADFAVTEKDGRVTGCASLYIYDSGLAEIRSLGIEPEIQGEGQGRLLVQFLIEKSKKLAVKKVFVLTRVPGFFQKLGFETSEKSALPEKVLKDCDLCPKQHRCDEIALEMSLVASNEQASVANDTDMVIVRSSA
ncbi:argininosuccinate lyase [Algicola sagamiensis]|uniref:argininosuccinate lyase n=1 Tax=Algicola sagamiensis TaxID=163869 RepID=UPI00036F4F1B|nr:argininosuccinate lyase [Algicola sagamiensis]